MPDIACSFSPHSCGADLGQDRLSRIAAGVFGGQPRLDCVTARLGALA